MKGQSAQEGLIIISLAMLLLVAINFLAAGWRVNTANIEGYLSNREECMKLSNEIHSLYILGDGANSTFRMLEIASVENSSIYVGDSSCFACCNFTDGSSNIFTISKGLVSLENNGGSIKISGGGDSVIFYDGFESWGSGDCAGSWTTCNNGDGEIRRSDPQTGSYGLRFRDHDADTNQLTQCVNLVGYSSATLSFWWKKSGLDSGEYGKLEVNSTSQAFTEVFDSGTGTSGYAQQTIDMTPYLSANTCIRFRSLASASNDHFYIDEVEITAS